MPNRGAYALYYCACLMIGYCIIASLDSGGILGFSDNRVKGKIRHRVFCMTEKIRRRLISISQTPQLLALPYFEIPMDHRFGRRDRSGDLIVSLNGRDFHSSK